MFKVSSSDQEVLKRIDGNQLLFCIARLLSAGKPLENAACIDGIRRHQSDTFEGEASHCSITLDTDGVGPNRLCVSTVAQFHEFVKQLTGTASHSLLHSCALFLDRPCYTINLSNLTPQRCLCRFTMQGVLNKYYFHQQQHCRRHLSSNF